VHPGANYLNQIIMSPRALQTILGDVRFGRVTSSPQSHDNVTLLSRLKPATDDEKRSAAPLGDGTLFSFLLATDTENHTTNARNNEPDGHESVRILSLLITG